MRRVPLNDLVEVFLAENLPEAYMVKAQLEAAGIVCFIDNENLQGALGEIPLGMATAPRVLVREKKAEQARQIIAETSSAKTRDSKS